MAPIGVRYILTCEKVNVNEDDTTDYINVFDNKTLKEIPTKLDFSLILSLEFQLNTLYKKKATIQILNPNDKALLRDLVIDLPTEEVDLKKKSAIVMNDIVLSNFPVNLEGYYTFQVLYDGNIIAKHDVMFIREGEK